MVQEVSVTRRSVFSNVNISSWGGGGHSKTAGGNMRSVYQTCVVIGFIEATVLLIQSPVIKKLCFKYEHHQRSSMQQSDGLICYI